MLIEIFNWSGDFAEDKDAAARVREENIRPCVSARNEIILDFNGVTLATQSFVHALISDVLRTEGDKALEVIEFRNCVDVVQGIISTVVQYSLDTLADKDEIEAKLQKDEAEKKQSRRFVEAARELGADQSEQEFDEALRRIAEAPHQTHSKKQR